VSLRHPIWAAIVCCPLFVSAGATVAGAVDVPPPPPPPDLRPAIHDWSGGYVGGFAGAGFIDTDYTPVPGPDPDLSGDGAMGGGFVGYNWQFGPLVVGAEGDFAFTSIDAENQLDAVEFDMPWLATVRARLGVADDRTLFYATGGLAIAEGEIYLPAFGETETETHLGFVVGGGIEHAVMENVTLRLEYLYARFETKTYGFSAGVVNLPFDDVHMVRAGAAWHFDPLY
jgi:outer membrane immunogenic protein